MGITRYDLSPACARVAEANGVAYFTGHVAAKSADMPTLYEQTAAVLRRYAELFEKFGYQKENILMVTGYIRDIDKIGEFEKAWDEWVDRDNAPACICVEATVGNSKPNLLELGMIVAVPEKD